MTSPKFDRAARLAVVQALYEIDVTDAPLERVLDTFAEKRWETLEAELAPESEYEDGELVVLPIPDQKRLRAIVRGTLAHQSEIDEKIKAQLETAEAFEQLEALSRVILRAAAHELIEAPKVPTGTIVSAYVSIAHAFFTENQPRLINAVLDSLAREIRGAGGDGAGI
ncbi:MAG: transcription antitermination factor NusB [Rhodospirillaceae bacterium]|nr:transcription antitermination factor NusB [Rhodospirillaceae bacterium]